MFTVSTTSGIKCRVLRYTYTATREAPRHALQGRPTQWADMQPSEKVLSCFCKGGDKQIMSLELLSIALGKFITFQRLHIAAPFCFCGRVVGIFRRASEQKRGDIFRQYWSGRRHAQGVFASPFAHPSQLQLCVYFGRERLSASTRARLCTAFGKCLPPPRRARISRGCQHWRT